VPNKPGVDQTRAVLLLELTRAIDTHIWFVGAIGGCSVQPVGAVPVLVTKLQEPPVGVAGCVADSLKINHSK